MMDWLTKRKKQVTQVKIVPAAKKPGERPDEGPLSIRFITLKNFHSNSLGRTYRAERQYNVHDTEQDLLVLLPKWIQDGKIRLEG